VEEFMSQNVVQRGSEGRVQVEYAGHEGLGFWGDGDILGECLRIHAYLAVSGLDITGFKRRFPN